jgi:hypothetical protein
MSKPSDVELCPCGSAKNERQGFHRTNNHDCRYHFGLNCDVCVMVQAIYAYLKGYRKEAWGK